MKILEELWLGNINPQECGSPKDPRLGRVLELLIKNDEAFRNTLSEPQKEPYEKLCDSRDELTELLGRKTFAEGFHLAVKIMVDVMNTMEIPSVDG